MMWIAVGLAMVAGWLASSPVNIGKRLGELRLVEKKPMSGWVLVAVGAVAFGLAGLLWFPMTLVACTGVIAFTSVWTIRQAVLRKKAKSRMEQTQQIVESMDSWLALGCLPHVAFLKTSAHYSLVESVGRAVELGIDPWDQLHRVASLPGCAGLGTFARAWEASHVSGSSISEALIHVRDQINENSEAAMAAAGELAGPRATGQALAVLPLFGLGVAWSFGGNPLTFFASTLGRPCLLAGVGLACAGVVWSEILARRADPLLSSDMRQGVLSVASGGRKTHAVISDREDSS